MLEFHKAHRMCSMLGSFLGKAGIDPGHTHTHRTGSRSLPPCVKTGRKSEEIRTLCKHANAPRKSPHVTLKASALWPLPACDLHTTPPTDPPTQMRSASGAFERGEAGVLTWCAAAGGTAVGSTSRSRSSGTV